MNINISFNVAVVIFWALICITTIFVFIKAIELNNANIEYNLKVKEMDLDNQNIKWLFNCDSSWQSGWYDCGSMQFRNLSGYYCNGTLMCANNYEVKA